MTRDSYWDTVFRRRYSRRLILRAGAGLGAAYVGLSMSGCAGEQAKPAPAASPVAKTPKAGGVFHFASYADAPDIDPHTTTTGPMAYVTTLTYNALLRTKTGAGEKAPESEIVPDLAQKWEQPDEVTYVFHLTPGVKNHDGTDFTAADAKFSLERIATPKAEFQRNYQFEMVSKVEAPDVNTVRVTMKQPFAPAINYFASPWNKMVPKHVVEKEGNLQKVAIGTGPFILKDYKRDVGWTFTKNPNYFVKGRPYLDGLDIPIQLDVATRLTNFRAERLDHGEAGAEDFQALKKSNPKMVYDRIPSGAWVYFGFRVDRPPFNDIRVRQAMAMALNLQEVIDTVHGGEGYVDFMVPISMKPWAVPHDRLGLPKRDIARAKQLLAEAGYPNGLKTSGITGHQVGVDTYQVLKPQFAQIGVDFEPKMLEFAAYQTARTVGDFEAQYNPLTVYTDVEETLYPFFHSKGTRNAGKWGSPELDAMLDKQRRATNLAERKKLIEDIQLYIAKQVWVIPMTRPYTYIVWQPWVKSFYATFTFGYQFAVFPEVWLDK